MEPQRKISEAKNLLVHYFRLVADKSGVNLDSDCIVEIEGVVDLIYEAAVEKVLSPKIRILACGEEIKDGDEYYNPLCDQWLPVEEELIGQEWDSDYSKPVRRKKS